MTTQDVIDYYKGLLILQYSTQPNALATMDAIIRSFVQDQIASKVRDGFDLETALGMQLDILGQYRGISRVVFGIVPTPVWSLPEAGDTFPGTWLGWTELSDPDPTWNWLQVNDLNSVAYALSDQQMRRLIRLKAAIDSWDGGLGTLDALLFAAFGSYVTVIDNMNGSITYQHSFADPDPDLLWNVAVTAGILPHPCGKSFTVTEVA